MPETATNSDKVGRVVPQSGYRGRVRSGCLTCRSRKVKCDEKRPNCNNCVRLERTCIYKPRQNRRHSVKDLNQGIVSSPESIRTPGINTAKEVDQASFTSPNPTEDPNDSNGELPPIDSTTPRESTHHPFLYPDESIVDDVTVRLEDTLRYRNKRHINRGDADPDLDSPPALISRDIELTTTMDILAAGEISEQPLFSFFIETVDCPPITAYDSLNWQWMKLEVTALAMSNRAISSAIMSVSMLHKASLFRLPLSKALSLYQSAKITFKELLRDETQDFDAALIASFLLCLFEFHHYELLPILRIPEDKFMKRLEAWAHQEIPHSPLSRRITIWLRLLYAATIRGGSKGLIAEQACRLLPDYSPSICGLPPPSNYPSDTPTHLCEMLSSPLLDFYQQLQSISTDIAKLTHYHRSRCTGTDQVDVVERIAKVRQRLHQLWESRSATQRQPPEDLRSHLASKIADPLITLIGICSAAYHAEFVEMGRVLGDPVTELTESKQAMQRIRDLVDGDWNAYDGSKLNVAYLRPLFLYAIECMDREGSNWAVEKLKDIRNPVSRSDFFAAFAKELSDAQLRKERRVTSKYFCIWHFGVPPPYL